MLDYPLPRRLLVSVQWSPGVMQCLDIWTFGHGHLDMDIWTWTFGHGHLDIGTDKITSDLHHMLVPFM